MGFLFVTVSRPALAPIMIPIQWIPGALSLGIKRPGRETDNSRPSNAGIRIRAAIPPPPINLYGVEINYSQGKLLPVNKD
jgi:hypothetical protein